MNKGIISIIIVVIIAGIVGIAYLGMFSEDIFEDNNQSDGFSNAIVSGPLTILQYEHRLSENVFLHIRGLDLNEKGNIRFFTPEGVLFKTISYDGSLKQDVNQYFKPEPSRPLQICTVEELIGEWTVAFDDNAYPPLKFKVSDVYLRGGEEDMRDAC